MKIDIKYIGASATKPSRIKLNSDKGGKEYLLPKNKTMAERVIMLLKQYKKDKKIKVRFVISDCLTCAIQKSKAIEA